MEVYEILERGLALIEKGWIPGKLWDGKGGFCALGAVAVTVGDRTLLGVGAATGTVTIGVLLTPEMTAAVNALNRAIEDPVPYDPYNQKSFRSDDPDTFGRVAAVSNSGKDAAIALFQRAIRNEKARVGVPLGQPAVRRDLSPSEVAS